MMVIGRYASQSDYLRKALMDEKPRSEEVETDRTCIHSCVCELQGRMQCRCEYYDDGKQEQTDDATCSNADLVNGLKHTADDHPCCRGTIEMAIKAIEGKQPPLDLQAVCDTCRWNEVGHVKCWYCSRNPSTPTDHYEAIQAALDGTKGEAG